MKYVTRVATVAAAATLAITMTAGAASTPTMAQLKAQAITLAQMPKGWTAHALPEDPRLGCLARVLEPAGVTETHLAEVYYLAPGDYPIFDETLSTYSNATLAYAKISASLAHCRTVSGDLRGFPVTGTVTRLAVPRYGNASVAYAISLAGKHITVKSDYLVVRKGKVVLGILEGSYPSVSLAQFRSLAAVAVTRAK